MQAVPEIIHDRRLGTAHTGAPAGNQSRDGFLHNCYNTGLGRFFQNTIKKGIESVIFRIHDKDIPRYDKTAYVYDDPRLQKLNAILSAAIDEVINDADSDRKREILHACKDICLFMLKEDIFYRPRILQAGLRVSREILENEDLFNTMTEPEAYNFVRYADGVNHAKDFSDMPMEERQKLPKNWTGLP